MIKMVPVRVLSLLLSLFILILHAYSFQEENVEAATTTFKECIGKESGVFGRKMMLNSFKDNLGTISMNNVQSGARKLEEKNTQNVKENVGHFVPEEKDLSGYFAFSADYRGPKRHPPKNN